MARFRELREFAGGVGRGFVGATKTGRRLANTVSLGALDQAIDAVRDVGDDFKPLVHALNPHSKLNVRDSESIRGASMSAPRN